MGYQQGHDSIDRDTNRVGGRPTFHRQRAITTYDQILLSGYLLKRGLIINSIPSAFSTSLRDNGAALESTLSTYILD